MGKQRPHDQDKSATFAKEKGNSVAEGSQQSRAPGASVPTDGNKQSDWAMAGQVNQNAQQGGFGGSEQGERGDVGAQQSGWSSRQQGQRAQARGDEAVQGASQQSGFGGAEQNQHAGSQESPVGPARSRQSGKGGAENRRAGRPGEHASDYGSDQSKQVDTDQ